jgi:hypothetical protein
MRSSTRGAVQKGALEVASQIAKQRRHDAFAQWAFLPFVQAVVALNRGNAVVIQRQSPAEIGFKSGLRPTVQSGKTLSAPNSKWMSPFLHRFRIEVSRDVK